MNTQLNHVAISNIELAAISYAGQYLADSHHGFLIWITSAGFTMQAELDPMTMSPVTSSHPTDLELADGAVIHLSTNKASMRAVYHPLHIVEAGDFFRRWASDLKLHGMLSECKRCA